MKVTLHKLIPRCKHEALIQASKYDTIEANTNKKIACLNLKNGL